MITAIIQSYRRQANIPIIINALRRQSVKPTRIIVWNDNDGSGKDLHNLGKDVEIINTNTNHNGNWGAFLFMFLADTKYIAIVDDDYPPAKDWFKFCVEQQEKHPGVYARFGITLVQNNYKSRRAIIAKVGRKVIFNKVDMVGQSYFFPKEVILPMFLKRPPSWLNNVDLHFSFMARKKGWNLYVPTVVNIEQLPWNERIKLVFRDIDKAMYLQKGHMNRRDAYVTWAIQNKIISRVI